MHINQKAINDHWLLFLTLIPPSTFGTAGPLLPIETNLNNGREKESMNTDQIRRKG